MKGRYDLGRSAVALLAAVVAAVGAYAAYGRLPIVPFLDTAVLLLGVEALIGLALAVWPGRPWAQRRLVALAAAVLGFVLMFPGPLISAIVVPGCVCLPDPNFPEPLGIGHQYWTIAGLVGFPPLMGLASLMPSRSGRVETPPEPGASNAEEPEPHVPSP